MLFNDLRGLVRINPLFLSINIAMVAVLSEKNFINNVNEFISDVNSSNCYYIWAGDTIPWANDSAPPASNTSVSAIEQSIYHDMVWGKLLTSSDIIQLIPNITWANNIAYAQYDHLDPNLYSKQFYVMNNVGAVYKIIDNNNGANSIIQPTLTPTSGTFQTSDGYTWKYMYTVSAGANTTFTSNSFIPVTPNTFVSNDAIPGSIDVTRVVQGGSGYQTYLDGYIRNVINQQTIQLPSTAIETDGFYVGCSMYLKAGLGAGQIQPIIGYNGLNQTAYLQNAFYETLNIQLANVNGTFLTGDNILQEYASIAFLFQQGYFNPGDSVYQSDSLATGTIITSNSAVLSLSVSNGAFTLSNAYPIVDTTQAGVLKSGTVSITAGSNTVTAVSGTNFTSNYSVGQFISVGSNNYLNVRRITSVNSSIITTALPFNNSLTANVHYLMPYACSPTSITLSAANAEIIQTNLLSSILLYGNTSSNLVSFILGEQIREFNANGVDQHANAIISYANSSTLVLSSVQGIFSPGLFITGQSSGLTAQTSVITSYPNITVAVELGDFISGAPIIAYYANGTPSGNAMVLNYTPSPSDDTEFIISPTVTFNGDGEGAAAYAVVNTTAGANYPIEEIVMINVGNNYTIANASVSGNTLWGSGANLYPVISPVEGHGFNAYEELGARYAGIAMTFDTPANELYQLPWFGSYRRVGIIKNPLFQNLWGNVGSPLRENLTIVATNGNTFVNGEIIIQPSTNAVGLVVVGNTTYLQLESMQGSFTTNAAVNTQIYGFTSLAQANVTSAANIAFSLTTNSIPIYNNNGSNAQLVQILGGSQLRFTNASGKFLANNIIYDPASNAYANLTNLLVSNAQVDITQSYGQRFNQTSRVTLSTNTTTQFQVGEYVTQATTNAKGLVLDTTSQLDFIISNTSGSFSLGTTLTDSNTSANAIILWANSTYMKVGLVNGTFNNNDRFTTLTGNGNITDVLSVLTLGDVTPASGFQVFNYTITGNASGAQGICAISNTATLPDLVRNSGDVLYVNNLTPFTRSNSATENISIILQF